MEKADIKKRVDSMREEAVKKRGESDNLKNPNEKECPFRDKVCNSSCKLFRANKPGYECPFQEISPMAWNIKSLIEKLIGK